MNGLESATRTVAWSAKWIGFDRPVQVTEERAQEGELKLPPAKYLRREFVLKREVRQATLRASSLGLYVVHVNGERVGQDFFTPGLTVWDRRTVVVFSGQ
jgi:alpha-L-rhamnosidase